MLSTFLIICGDDRIASSIAKSLQDNTAAPASEERELIDEIPKHVPIKVKIKKEKEKAFKDLKNEKWVRDFQLEITNTGTKPIYYLSLDITLPEITGPGGLNMGFTISYGRNELISIDNKAEPEDVPIKPGETYVYSFSESKVEGWEQFRQEENKPDAKKLRLRFQIINFGDRTGFVSTGGTPIPQPTNVGSNMGRCVEKPNLNDPGGVRGQHASRRSWPQTVSMNDLPAQFLLANFLSAKSSHAVSSKPNPQSMLCCPSGCYRSKPYSRPCFCGGEYRALDAASCSDPLGGCYVFEFRWDRCAAGYCLQTNFLPCGATTPTPSPSPSPGTATQCDENSKPTSTKSAFLPERDSAILTNCNCVAHSSTRVGGLKKLMDARFR